MSEELERPIEAEVETMAVPSGEAESSPDASSADGPTSAPSVPANTGDASLLALIDRLGGMLERSDLTELEVEVGGTALILRKPAPLAQPAAAAVATEAQSAAALVPGSATSSPAEPAAPSQPSIKAPLTGIWYSSPTPGSAPFVEVGREVAVGQVVGLIEAMKLFNEIKSELAGRVVRVVPESGALVKAKQPLIEVDPL
jgi:acetyl-CoA carboxylase biotin carboxyl carrier protein